MKVRKEAFIGKRFFGSPSSLWLIRIPLVVIAILK
jgi:hypothetical protein